MRMTTIFSMRGPWRMTLSTTMLHILGRTIRWSPSNTFRPDSDIRLLRGIGAAIKKTMHASTACRSILCAWKHASHGLHAAASRIQRYIQRNEQRSSLCVHRQRPNHWRKERARKTKLLIDLLRGNTPKLLITI